MAEPSVQKGLPDWISDHIRRYRENPKDGHMWDASVAGYNAMVPTLLLTTTGRKSGRQLVLPLIYGKTAKGYAIIASKGGAPAHPRRIRNQPQPLPSLSDEGVAVGEERQAEGV